MVIRAWSEDRSSVDSMLTLFEFIPFITPKVYYIQVLVEITETVGGFTGRYAVVYNVCAIELSASYCRYPRRGV